MTYGLTCTAPVEEKIFEQEVPRYLEEEGLYVGRKPSVPRRHLNRMENRLLKNKEAVRTTCIQLFLVVYIYFTDNFLCDPPHVFNSVTFSE